MSQLSLSLDTPLMVRDGRGRYRPADADQILEAARQVIKQKMQRGEAFTSPTAVKDYLRAKLAGFEHEVFAVLFLDLCGAVSYVKYRVPEPLLMRFSG